jgi:predicted acetyltransferase
LSLTIRTGKAEDVPRFASLAAHSFPAVGYSLGEWEEYLSTDPRGTPEETLWVGEENGRLTAGCHLYHFEQWIGGVRFPMMGLGTVAISATERRRGLAGELVAAGLRHARERGETVSALYPFRTSFYQRLGYALAGEVVQYRLPPNAFPDHEGRRRVELAESAEARAQVAAIYDRWAPTQTGQLVRPEHGWEPVWQRGTRHGALYRGEDGRGSGYLVFRYHIDAQRGGRGVEVEECVSLDTTARLALYGWLSSLRDQWDFVIYRAHPDEAFSELATELRYPAEGIPRWHFWFPTGVALSGPMFRILDMERAWSARPVHTPRPVRVALEVHDPDLEENAGAWTLHLAEDRVEVSRSDSGAVDLRMALSIETLSRIFIGASSPSTAVMLGRARADDAAALPLLDAALALPRPWTFDRF